MLENEVILKRAIFGGFDRRQVMEYIAYLHNKQNAVKAELEELEHLKSTVAELEAEIAEKDNMIGRLNTEVEEAGNGTRLGRASATLLKESIAYADCYIDSAKALAYDISEKTNERVDEAKDKIEGIMSYLGGISDSLLGLYSSMDTLKSEYECFGDVYPEAQINVSYPEFKLPVSDTFSDAVQVEEPVVAEDEELEDSFPSDDEMTSFLRTMEARYREILNS